MESKTHGNNKKRKSHINISWNVLKGHLNKRIKVINVVMESLNVI